MKIYVYCTSFSYFRGVDKMGELFSLVKSSPVATLAVYATLRSSLGKRPLDVQRPFKNTLVSMENLGALLQTSLAFEKARQNFYGKLRFPDSKQK